MENFYLEAVARDLQRRLVGATIGKVWQPSDRVLLVDARARDARLLFVTVDPTAPALFLTERSPREFEGEGASGGAFAAVVRKRLGGGRIVAVEKPRFDRFVSFVVETYDAAGAPARAELVVELTGRSANAYVLDAGGTVVATLRQTRGQRLNLPGTPYSRRVTPEPKDVLERLALEGATIRAELDARNRVMGDEAASSLERDLARPATEARLYGPPEAPGVLATFALLSQENEPCEVFDDPHASADERARRAETARALASRRGALVARVRASRERAERALAALEADFLATEGAERLREIGESILAQVASAKPVEAGYAVLDYYADPPVEIVVEADRGETPQRVANRLFARYQKARRTREQVASRSEALARELSRLRELEGRVAAAASDEALEAIAGDVDAALGARARTRAARTSSAPVSGARRFVSSDGYEILVGRSSASNDAITFKIARPSDLWLHVADYPGSHVVVRNPTRAPIPHRTIVEAAQLAAFYSQAGDDTLVEVRYTPRRFVSKPRGSAPGLVRLSEFKTIAVRPSSETDRPR